MIINYPHCIVYDICAVIMFVLKYEKNRQLIAQVINYQPAMYVSEVCCEYIIYQGFGVTCDSSRSCY